MLDPRPPDIFHPGQVLNNTYEIEGVLGRGGTGEIYRARNQISGRVVAIKALSAAFSGRDEYIDLMRREEEMRAIQHDSVVRYTECSRSADGHVFLVMDFIDGVSLETAMETRRLDARELMIVAHRVCEGLVATHARGIVHRDLSPDNIILRGGDPEAAVIIDFGIAKDTAAGARTIVGNNFAGKYEYAAPEQVDGRVDARSDLYALGALLLAAWHGRAPFLGATPGEIVRSKARPLDAEGVPEPLRGLIDWLAAPDPDKRPQSATEALARIGAELRPKDGPSAPRPRRRRGGRTWLLAPPIVLVALWIGWATGLFEGLFPTDPPLADPYLLTAWSAASGEGELAGNAPDPDAAERLRQAFLATTPGGTGALEVASGAPVEHWTEHVVALVRILGGAESWKLALSGASGGLEAVAPDRDAGQRLEAAVSTWSSESSIALDARIAMGPERLPVATVRDLLREVATCGPLVASDAADGAYGLGQLIEVTGDVAAAEDGAAIESRLASAVGDRQVVANVRVLNHDLCAVRAALPAAPSDRVAIRLSDGLTGAANLSGVFDVDGNPVVDVLTPADLDGSLWVFIVDNSGRVYHVLPNQNRLEHDLAAIGEVESGVRRTRVLFPLKDAADPTRLVMQVDDENLGKSEVVAVVSRSDLFDMRRPRDESVGSMVEALTEALAGRDDEILGIASRIIEARRSGSR